MAAARLRVADLSGATAVARGSALIVGLVGVAVLCGWVADIQPLKSVLTDYATMKPNTATLFVISAGGVWLATAKRGGAVFEIAMAVVMLGGLLTLIEYAADVDLHIDQLLFADLDTPATSFPGRMSVITAANFVLFGAAMALSRRDATTAKIAFTTLCMAVFLASVLALIGYAYGVPALYRPAAHSSISLHTAAMFILLSVGALATRPDVGCVALLRSDGPGGAVARRLLPAVLLLPPIIGWLVLLGERAGLHSTVAGIALFAVANVTIFGAIVWLSSGQAERVERARRSQERIHHAVLETALDAFILMDESGRILEWNPQAEAMFGWRREEAVGMRVADTVIPAPQRSAHESGLAHFLATGKGNVLRKRIEVDAHRRDGSLLTVELIITPIRIDDRWIFGGFVRDITERKSAEAALRESEQRYRHVVELIQEAVWIHREGTILFANPAAAKLFGANSVDALQGRSIFSLLHPDDRERALERTRTVTTERRAVPVAEMRLAGLDGRTRTAELHAVPFMQEGRLHILSAGRDVTGLREAEAQLRHAQKMESVGQLTGGVAHDFNNLLTVVIGSLDLALGRAQPELRSLIDGALKAAERGAGLVRQLLAFSRRQTLIPESLDCNRLASGMEDLLRRTLGEDIDIEMKPAPALWPALADKGQVESALLNLAINARDAMPAGGKLTIETGNIHLDEDYAARNAEVTPGDYVMLAVTDTGSGMPPEVAERAFEPFFTTKGVGKGTGLGLSMIYGFAKQSGGHLKIYSEVGHGTTIRLYLPRVSAPGTVMAEPKSVPAEHPRGGETILVVEDDSDVRGFVVAQLRDLGYRVIEATNGREARSVLESDQAIDLLLTDVVLPGGTTGRNLADGAKARRPNLKTLFTSGYTENSIIHRGNLDPGVNFLPKPYRRQELALKVRKALDA